MIGGKTCSQFRSITENALNIGGVVMVNAGGWMVWSFLRQPDRQAEVKVQG